MMYARLRPIRSPILLPIRMNAADTRASSAIADWTPLAVVCRSWTTAEIETFISDVSTTSTNIAIARRTASFVSPPDSATGGATAPVPPAGVACSASSSPPVVAEFFTVSDALDVVRAACTPDSEVHAPIDVSCGRIALELRRATQRLGAPAPLPPGRPGVVRAAAAGRDDAHRVRGARLPGGALDRLGDRGGDRGRDHRRQPRLLGRARARPDAARPLRLHPPLRRPIPACHRAVLRAARRQDRLPRPLRRR